MATASHVYCLSRCRELSAPWRTTLREMPGTLVIVADGSGIAIGGVGGGVCDGVGGTNRVGIRGFDLVGRGIARAVRAAAAVAVNLSVSGIARVARAAAAAVAVNLGVSGFGRVGVSVDVNDGDVVRVGVGKAAMRSSASR